MVDAGVVVKCFIEEEFSEDAGRIRDDYASDMANLEAHSLMPFDVLNAIRFSGLFSSSELRRVAEALDALAVPASPLAGSVAAA